MVPGAGDRDVGEPALLRARRAPSPRSSNAVELVDELLAGRRRRATRDRGRSAASPRNAHGSWPKRSQPLAPCGAARAARPSTSRGTATRSHSRPFEPWMVSTCTVPGSGSSGRGREVLALLGLAQPGEEAAEGRARQSDREVAGERVERAPRAAPAERAVLVGGDLDVEPQLLHDQRDEVGQVEPGAARGAARRPARRRAAARGRLAEPLRTRCARPRRVREEVERVDDRAALALGERVAHAARAPRRAARAGRCRGSCSHDDSAPSACRSRTPMRQREPASRRTSSHARRRGSCTHRQRADEVGDLGLGEQAADAEHVVRHPALAERGEEHRLVLAGAEQQRGAGRPPGPALDSCSANQRATVSASSSTRLGGTTTSTGSRAGVRARHQPLDLAPPRPPRKRRDERVRRRRGCGGRCASSSTARYARAVAAELPRERGRGCRRSRRASRRSTGSGRRPPSPACPANSSASSQVCTTEVSWYSSSSTTRCSARSSSTSAGCARRISSASATWSEYSTKPRRRFAAPYSAARSTSRSSAPTFSTSVADPVVAVPRTRAAARAMPAKSRASAADRLGVGDVVGDRARDREHRLGELVERRSCSSRRRSRAARSRSCARAARPPPRRAPRRRPRGRSPTRCRGRAGSRRSCRSRLRRLEVVVVVDDARRATSWRDARRSCARRARRPPCG